MSDSGLPPKFSAALISLGVGWARFTYAREHLELLGVVQIGMQIGALAKLPSGEYVQVNGDFIAPLDRGILESALRRAGLQVNRSTRVGGPADVAKPTVIFKKRRRVAVTTA